MLILILSHLKDSRKHYWILNNWAKLKFIYSEKVTKFCEIFSLLLSYLVPVKSKVKISQNFLAFLECMNFINVSKANLAFILARCWFLSSATWKIQGSIIELQKSRNSLKREIACVLIIQQKFQKFEFFYCAQWKNSNFQNFCWLIRMQPISLLKLFLLLLGLVINVTSKANWTTSIWKSLVWKLVNGWNSLTNLDSLT